MYVQYGAGLSGPPNWLNYDASPTLRVQRLPLLGRFASHLIGPKFPASVSYGDITKGLPVADGSARGVYASHVLEHLALNEFRIALRNTLKMMQAGAIFRCIVPDLAGRALRYVDDYRQGNPGASSAFMRACCLGMEERPRGLAGRARAAIGSGFHLWMWDENGLRQELLAAGFCAVRRCELGDAGDPMFDLVEWETRFVDPGFDPPMPELAMEARRPEA